MLVVELTPLSHAFAQTVNPALDGKIVYVALNKSQVEGWTKRFLSANPDGSATQELFNTAVESNMLCMSMDGNVIAYVTLERSDTQVNGRLWTMKGNGTHAVKLPDTVCQPTISPLMLMVTRLHFGR